MKFVGLFLLITGSINSLWKLFVLLVGISATAGAKLSKKTKFAKSGTDGYISQGKEFNKKIINQILWSLGITAIGALIYFFTSWPD